MGSLKDEMRGLREDHKPCEKAEDGEHPGASDDSVAPKGPESQESTAQVDYQPKLHMNASYSEEREETPTSKDEGISAEVCENTDQSDSIGGEDSALQPEGITMSQQPEAEPTAAAHNSTTMANMLHSDGDEEVQDGGSKDKNVGPDREKGSGIENISVLVPSTPGPLDPRSPAPPGQHHMRTQVSLEVVQCRSAATSPMTPPEGGSSFFFPTTLVRSGGVGTDSKDAELQVGQQTEYCSVATSPMTPKTPSTTAFPELIGRETIQKEEKMKQSEEQRESLPETKSPAESESEITGAVKLTTSKEPSEGCSSDEPPESAAGHPAARLIVSQETLEGSDQQSKQQRMGSMDQDITILVTHHGNTDEEEEKAESSCCPTGPEMVKIEEDDEETQKKNCSSETPEHVEETSSTTPQNKTEEVSACDEVKKSEAEDSSSASAELRDVSVSKPPVPESPAPFGCHNIRTQVSLEVVQCQSAATSPMTPPEGDQAFCFPSSLGRGGAVGAETKDAELQVGQQVEFRSVATAPMTPRTPINTTFPEIKKEGSTEEKIVEEEEDKEEEKEEKEGVAQKEKELMKVEEAEGNTSLDSNCNKEEKCEEPVQEVSWDEKGMTWEVYGAVVEVTVLGSAIQKHLEKQVKKQKQQPSLHPPPPLNPSAVPLTSESAQGGSGKGRAGKRGEQDEEAGRRRRNPFRLLMENMQQPHCCTRAHSAE